RTRAGRLLSDPLGKARVRHRSADAIARCLQASRGTYFGLIVEDRGGAKPLNPAPRKQEDAMPNGATLIIRGLRQRCQGHDPRASQGWSWLMITGSSGQAGTGVQTGGVIVT